MAENGLVRPVVPFFLNADTFEVPVIFEDKTTLKIFEHVVNAAFNFGAVAGRKYFLDVDGRPQRRLVFFQQLRQIGHVVDGWLVELEAVNSGLQQRFQYLAVLAAGVHEYFKSAFMGNPEKPPI